MNRLIPLLFSLTLFSFMGVSIYLFSGVFTTNLRWLLVLTLGGTVIMNLPRSEGDRSSLFTLYLYLLWCVFSSFWSESFDLSFAKSIALIIVVFSMLLGGKILALREGQGAMNYLLPTALVSLVAAGLGYFFSPFAFDGQFYQGFVYGSNMLGSLMAIVMPWCLWQAYVHRGTRRWIAWWLLPGFSLLFIFMSQSRASLLVALFTIGGLLLAVSPRKLIGYVYVLGIVVLLTAWFRFDFIQGAMQQVVYKHGERAFYTREQPWEDSWQAANQGGWFGGGYGVSIGAGTWGGGWSAVGYGREKGNSQLAIVEETGIIGLSLYLVLVATLASRIFMAFRRSRDPDMKIALGIMLGAWFGLLVHSIFEGWWVAPGSPESAAFWALTGVALGWSTLVDRNNRLNGDPVSKGVRYVGF